MSVKRRYYVFHEDDFTLSWIDKEVSKKISEYFVRNDFEEVNVDDLVKVMNEGIRNPNIDITIVFSHDVIPDKLLDKPSSPTPNSLFRRFLNVGHTIIWLGDVPGWYMGIGGEKKPLQPQPASIQNLIGIDRPLRTDERVVTAKPTVYGLLFGIKSWGGKRPHSLSVQSGFHMIPLAVGVDGVHGFICSPRQMLWGLSGLVRLYDFHLTLRTLTNEMLRSILNIALKATVWDELISLAKKFEMLRDEIDEKLGKKLDLIIKEIRKLRQNRSQNFKSEESCRRR